MSVPYLMEDERESLRLINKVDPPYWVNRFFSDYISPNSYVLDIGCGPGVIARQLALQFPTSCVYGVDGSQFRLDKAVELPAQSNLFFCQADAYSLPFDSNTFDFIFCRFLLEYLKNPVNAILEMQRVCKPDGLVLLQDIDGQLVWHYPIEKSFENKINSVIEHLKSTGFDPFIGRKLYSYVMQAKLKPLQVKIEPYHLYPGRIDDDSYSQWELKLDIAMPALVSALGQDGAVRFKQEFQNNLLDDTTLTYSNLFSVLAKKE